VKVGHHPQRSAPRFTSLRNLWLLRVSALDFSSLCPRSVQLSRHLVSPRLHRKPFRMNSCTISLAASSLTLLESSSDFRSVGLTPLECTLLRFSLVSPLESALIQVFILKNLKLFRMNTQEKHRGRGGWLTRHFGRPPLSVTISRLRVARRKPTCPVGATTRWWFRGA
jgi:hypothetical protein